MASDPTPKKASLSANAKPFSFSVAAKPFVFSVPNPAKPKPSKTPPSRSQSTPRIDTSAPSTPLKSNSTPFSPRAPPFQHVTPTQQAAPKTTPKKDPWANPNNPWAVDSDEPAELTSHTSHEPLTPMQDSTNYHNPYYSSTNPAFRSQNTTPYRPNRSFGAGPRYVSPFAPPFMPKTQQGDDLRFIYTFEELFALRDICTTRPKGLPATLDINMCQVFEPYEEVKRTSSWNPETSLKKGNRFKKLTLSDSPPLMAQRKDLKIQQDLMLFDPSLLDPSANQGTGKGWRTKAPTGTPAKKGKKGGKKGAASVPRKRGRKKNKSKRRHVSHSAYYGGDEELTRTENGWHRIAPESETDKAVTQLRAILNKLAPATMDKMIAQCKDIVITNDATLREITKTIYVKAVDEPYFAAMYAQFTAKLNEHFTTNLSAINSKEKDGQHIDKTDAEKKGRTAAEKKGRTAAEKKGEPDKADRGDAKYTDKQEDVKFSSLLLAQCYHHLTEGPDYDNLDPNNEDDAEEIFKLRQREKGNVVLIAQLFQKNLMSRHMLYLCLDMLLEDGTHSSEADVENLCILLKDVGKLLHKQSVTEATQQIFMGYMERVMALTRHQGFGSRIRFMLEDIVKLCDKERWIKFGTSFSSARKQGSRPSRAWKPKRVRQESKRRRKTTPPPSPSVSFIKVDTSPRLEHMSSPVLKHIVDEWGSDRKSRPSAFDLRRPARKQSLSEIVTSHPRAAPMDDDSDDDIIIIDDTPSPGALSGARSTGFGAIFGSQGRKGGGGNGGGGTTANRNSGRSIFSMLHSDSGDKGKTPLHSSSIFGSPSKQQTSAAQDHKHAQIPRTNSNGKSNAPLFGGFFGGPAPSSLDANTNSAPTSATNTGAPIFGFNSSSGTSMLGGPRFTAQAPGSLSGSSLFGRRSSACGSPSLNKAPGPSSSSLDSSSPPPGSPINRRRRAPSMMEGLSPALVPASPPVEPPSQDAQRRDIRRQSQLLIEEYCSSRDLEEARMCIKDMQDQYPTLHRLGSYVFQHVIQKVFEMKASNRECCLAFFEDVLSTHAVIAKNDLIRGVSLVFDDLPETCMDTPLAPVYVASVLGIILSHKVLTVHECWDAVAGVGTRWRVVLFDALAHVKAKLGSEALLQLCDGFNCSHVLSDTQAKQKALKKRGLSELM